MAIVTWRRRNPNELAALRNGMEDWFDGFFRGLDRPLSLFGPRAWPAIDVAEKEDAILVRAEVPGMKPEEIEISVYGNTLTISGEKKEAKEDVHDKSPGIGFRPAFLGSYQGSTRLILTFVVGVKEDQNDGFYHVESTYGSFHREVALPTDVDEKKIEAVCKDGVLSVTLPKAEKSKAVKVQVKG